MSSVPPAPPAPPARHRPTAKTVGLASAFQECTPSFTSFQTKEIRQKLTNFAQAQTARYGQEILHVIYHNSTAHRTSSFIFSPAMRVGPRPPHRHLARDSCRGGFLLSRGVRRPSSYSPR